jgi:site-specific DNA recombinase
MKGAALRASILALARVEFPVTHDFLPKVISATNRHAVPANRAGASVAVGLGLAPQPARHSGRLGFPPAHSRYPRAAFARTARRLPAGEIEALVLDQLRGLLRQPEVVVGAWRAAQAEAPDLAEDAVRDALARFEPVWSELFPAEQERLIRLLVQRVVVGEAGAQISLNLEGLASLARDLSQPREIAA